MTVGDPEALARALVEVVREESEGGERRSEERGHRRENERRREERRSRRSEQREGDGEPRQESRHRRRKEPEVDLIESPEEVTVLCDLPGCRGEDIELRSNGETLRIEADREPTEEENGLLRKRERPERAERRIELPARTNVEKAQARHEDGVLKVDIPKQEEERERLIGLQ